MSTCSTLLWRPSRLSEAVRSILVHAYVCRVSSCKLAGCMDGSRRVCRCRGKQHSRLVYPGNGRRLPHQLLLMYPHEFTLTSEQGRPLWVAPSFIPPANPVYTFLCLLPSPVWQCPGAGSSTGWSSSFQGTLLAALPSSSPCPVGSIDPWTAIATSQRGRQQ